MTRPPGLSRTHNLILGGLALVIFGLAILIGTSQR
jgi:hypothetical protein